MKRCISCCLLALCLLLVGCAASQAAEDGDGNHATVLYWTGADDSLLTELLAQQEPSKDVLMSSFRGSIQWQEQTVELSFLWGLYDGSIYLAEEQTQPELRCAVEAIPGCTTAVLVTFYGQEQLEEGCYALAWLDSGEIQWLLPELLADYPVRLLVPSPDLTQLIFWTKENAYYYDGQQVLDLAQHCGIEVGQDYWLTAHWQEDDIILTATNGTTTDCFVYDGETGYCRQTAAGLPCYIPDRQENGLQFYGGYGTLIQRGTLRVIDLHTGTVYDSGVSAETPYTVTTIGGELLVLLDE